MTLNGVMTVIFCAISPKSAALGTNYVNVVEIRVRPIMSHDKK